MSRSRFVVASLAASCAGLTLAVSVPVASSAPAPQGSRGLDAKHARVVEYWSASRRAAATPRDLVIDARGQAYLRKRDGSLEPYGRRVANSSGAIAPNAKPGGSGDNTPPSISNLDPAAGATIGASHTFAAKVTDASGLRSVKFSVQKAGSLAQSFSATLTSNDVWTVSLQGFSDGNWSWWVVAKDKANNTETSPSVAFKVSTGGGGDPGGDDTVTNAPWDQGGVVQTAAGRIYFEMPSNPRWTRWSGYVCSGTAVTDGANNRSVILTAAHCVYDDVNKAFARNVLFIPNQDGTTGAGTDLNCNNDPLGCWMPSFGVVDINWTTRTFPDNIPWDYAYYVVPDTAAHAGTAASSDALDQALVTLPISFEQPSVDDGIPGTASDDYTHALGYSYSDDPDFMYCAEDMTTEGADNWWLPSCELSGGSSGGPWIQAMTASGTGNLISVNSWGYTTSPGMAGPKLYGTSASCVFSQAKSDAPGPSAPEGEEGLAVTCP